MFAAPSFRMMSGSISSIYEFHVVVGLSFGLLASWVETHRTEIFGVGCSE